MPDRALRQYFACFCSRSPTATAVARRQPLGARRNVTPLENGQTRETFAAEATAIFDVRKTVIWRRPSRSELDQVDEPEAKIESGEIPETGAAEPAAVLRSSTRGTILHKLIEEVLTGEACDARADLKRGLRN